MRVSTEVGLSCRGCLELFVAVAVASAITLSVLFLLARYGLWPMP